MADILFVMCTNGMFLVPRETPGVEFMPEPRNHNHIRDHDVRVPRDHLLGPEDGVKVLRDYKPHEGYFPNEYFPTKRLKSALSIYRKVREQHKPKQFREVCKLGDTFQDAIS